MRQKDVHFECTMCTQLDLCMRSMYMYVHANVGVYLRCAFVYVEVRDSSYVYVYARIRYVWTYKYVNIVRVHVCVDIVVNRCADVYARVYVEWHVGADLCMSV